MLRFSPAAGLAAVLSFALIAPGVASPAPAAPAADPDPTEAIRSVPTDYRLDVGDTILVDVLRHTEINRSLVIPADGVVRLPRLRAPVPARGKTAGELADALAENWAHVFRLRPNAVTVTVTAPRARRIYVRGNGVKSSGEFLLKPGLRVSEIVALAGGTAVPAERVETVVTNERRSAPVKVNLYEALTTPGSEQDVALLEGDTVTLETHRTIRLYVQGEGPRGVHEIDDRDGLRRALVKAGYSTTGAAGALREARIIRKAVEGDPTAPDQIIPVDLYAVMTEDGKDVALRDMDLLYVPPTRREVYVFGTIHNQGKHGMREDRPTRLADVLAVSGLVNGQSSTGNINILRMVDGKPTTITADFGRFLKNQDAKHNPEIQPQDVVYVANVKRTDVGQIWTGFGLWNLFKTVLGGGL